MRSTSILQTVCLPRRTDRQRYITESDVLLVYKDGALDMKKENMAGQQGHSAQPAVQGLRARVEIRQNVRL